ncbi:MAG TPA: ATP-binding cassette domain-containing protein [Firmicutes bacterium]|nr:ATP-binding cassette domain-containing protein [Bacillota bacterium]
MLYIILKSSSGFYNREGRWRQTLTEPIVEAKNLSKNYGAFQAVKGIDFSIYPGECFGILGPNGAGKTTTAAMMHCFLPLTSGSLNVFGMDTQRCQRQIKKRLGVVSQENNLDQELTVIENLIVYAGYFDLGKKAALAKAVKLLAFFNLTKKKDVSVEKLSGGMKRRLALARGLINDPELLILDEPTTGLDPEAKHLICQHLRLLKQQGLTIVLTTHYLEEASHLCDNLIIIDHGKIIETGSPQNLVAKHIGSHVLELEIPREKEALLLPELGEVANGCQRLGSVFFIYLKDNIQYVTAKLEQFPFISYRQLRPANLEDVFLKLTGKELDHD